MPDFETKPEMQRITWTAPRPEYDPDQQTFWDTWYDAENGQWVLLRDEVEVYRDQDAQAIMDELSREASDGDVCAGLPVWFAYQDDPWFV